MKDRGMVKWAPYKSLTEQEDFMKAMRRKKAETPKPSISSDKAERINDLLVNYAGQEVAIDFYLAGSVKESRGVLVRVDTIYKFIEMNGIRIPFNSIVDAYCC
jgi:hypothetical protein